MSAWVARDRQRERMATAGGERKTLGHRYGRASSQADRQGGQVGWSVPPRHGSMPVGGSMVASPGLVIHHRLEVSSP